MSPSDGRARLDATNQLPARLRRISFRCPSCRRGPLVPRPGALDCGHCRASYPFRDGSPCFSDAGEAEITDGLARFKAALRSFPRLYRLLVFLVSPLYFDRSRRRFIDAEKDGILVNLGSGNLRVDESVPNFDMAAYPNVDVICDVTDLPLVDESVDAILASFVLEHLPEPRAAVREMFRVLRPGGRIFSEVPFVVGYHAAPGDFRRWTHEGVLRLHREFEPERLLPRGGPTSALLWVFQEWVAVLLCLGSWRLHRLVYLVVMVVTFPVKFLDLLMQRIPQARNINACFAFVGRKPAGSAGGAGRPDEPRPA